MNRPAMALAPLRVVVAAPPVVAASRVDPGDGTTGEGRAGDSGTGT